MSGRQAPRPGGNKAHAAAGGKQSATSGTLIAGIDATLRGAGVELGTIERRGATTTGFAMAYRPRVFDRVFRSL